MHFRCRDYVLHLRKTRRTAHIVQHTYSSLRSSLSFCHRGGKTTLIQLLNAQYAQNSRSVNGERHSTVCERSGNCSEYNPSKPHSLMSNNVCESCDLIILMIFFVTSSFAFASCSAASPKAGRWFSSRHSLSTTERQGTTTRATPTPIRRRAEKMSTLMGVVRGAHTPPNG